MTKIEQTKQTIIRQVIVNGKVVKEKRTEQIIKPAKDAEMFDWDIIFPGWDWWWNPRRIRKRRKKKRLIPKR